MAKRVALGGSRPKPRDGLSELQQRSRRARDWKRDFIDVQIASVEWGTFLGPGHLRHVDVAKLRASGAFARVLEVSPQLAFLQVTADPGDDVTGALETKLAKAREVLAPVMMDVSDVTLD